MSTSRCILLTGTGNRYHGEGFVPRDIFTFFDDKPVCQWISLSGEHEPYLFMLQHPENCFYDALLVFSIHCLEIDENGQYAALKKSANSLLRKEEDIPMEIYEMSKQAVSESERCIKVVGVFLGNEITVIGNFTDRTTMKQLFLNAVAEFKIKNFEVCESVAAGYYGAFDS